MTEHVNHTSSDIVGKTVPWRSNLGDLRQIKNGHKALRGKAKATRALQVIEAVTTKPKRWR